VSIEVEQQVWIQAWATRIRDLGLSQMALLLLEFAGMGGFLGSQLILAVQPLLGGLVSDTTVERAAMLLESVQLQELLTTSLRQEGG
jgi:hypothetical protein